MVNFVDYEEMEATCDERFLFAMPEAKQPSKVRTIWQQIKDMKELSDEVGMLLPRSVVPKMLDLSKQRVSQLCLEGTLRTWEFNGQQFCAENDILSFLTLERKAGRPWKAPSLKESWKIGREVAQGK